MSRALLAGLVLMVACVGRKLPEVEGELAAAKTEQAALDREVAKAAADLTVSETGRMAQQSRLAQATRSLTQYQANAAGRWRGDAKELAQLKKEAAALPPALLKALDAAQAAGKDATPEKRFEQSLNKGDLADVATLIDGWEADEFPYKEPEAAEDCKNPPDVPELHCRKDVKRGMLLCDGETNTWLIWSEHGTLLARSAPAAGLEIVERPAPGVWVLGKGAEHALYETPESGFLLRWVAAVDPKTTKVSWKNLDDDPFPEGILEHDGSVRLLDVVSAHNVSQLDEADSCRRLIDAKALPESGKASCATRLAALSAAPDAGH
jgi:hypothetical protein